MGCGRRQGIQLHKGFGAFFVIGSHHTGAKRVSDQKGLNFMGGCETVSDVSQKQSDYYKKKTKTKNNLALPGKKELERCRGGKQVSSCLDN